GKIWANECDNYIVLKLGKPLILNSLAFICDLYSGLSLPTGERQQTAMVLVRLPAQCSVHQLRLCICMQAQELNRHPDPLSLLDPVKFPLLYAKGADWYEIFDDYQVLRTLDVPWERDSHGQRVARIVVSPQPDDTEERQSNRRALVSLIGHDLDTVAANRLGEVSFTRRKLVSPRQEELRRRDPRAYATEPWTTSVPTAKDQEEQFSRKLTVTMHYNEICYSLKVDLKITPEGLREVFHEVLADHALQCESGDLVLKVCGRDEFLSGDLPLSRYVWVCQCLKSNQELHLSVVFMSQLDDDTVRSVEWPLVDTFTGLSSSHEEMSLEGKDVHDIIMISLWDCKRKFRVKLLGFDIPQPSSKPPQSVHVEASILYGSKVVSSVCSTPKAFADEVLWNEWLEFDILLRDLPRGAKLGLTINDITHDSAGTKECKSPSSGVKAQDEQRGKGKLLYFVNLLLIDHRSVLTQGPHTLHMWAYPRQEEEAFTYKADKLSTATNPDVADSMAISFLLDRYTFPVFLPHSTTSNGSCFSPVQTLPSHDSSFLDKSLPPTVSDPFARPSSSPAVTDKASMRRFREESVRYASNLPQFLRRVNWLSPGSVQEVHWLLSQWEPQELDVSVALELLSVDFADEIVRKLAVQRLESLSNDEVLKYLLQLVQTLKVEPYHDSFLARFLIQRALRSKRIGHFFFWYLRSEVVGSPFFRQRMAVVLEAYLLGCGQAMLNGFKRQMQAVDALREVASVVKRLYPDKMDLPSTAALKLQDLLRTCNLPSDFQVPFDPRIRAGKILVRCKIMASKKKPLWLEFSCMDSPGPSYPPVGIIFKQGDDLRQDMLVLQTLVVMDSIWQEKSLGLNLVPYGCISTGHNIGMIEIVRDAVTIAAVQRIQGGTNGAFKNDALFNWLKEKCPIQEIPYQAMETFVTSCAGYCVATYVLGIGDRHNDNIMITDQGNLFHIDFGHILGNTKRFLGVNKERAPFVLTPDFLYVMGRVKSRPSLYFQRFRDTCTQAYLSLRSHSRLLVTLFSLMLLTGIPELSAAEDLHYLREALQEDKGEDEARDHFLQMIAKCEDLGWTVQAMWWFHMMVGIK
uniref:Phosphatidylinositol 4,5-bisphosphate 3-kinase catalytic subunit gamma isoform n=2 Tax=Esox lucius TaxID=8010 RepID=A0A3P8XZM4_ESOLU